jgi:hypothetical protein
MVALGIDSWPPMQRTGGTPLAGEGSQRPDGSVGHRYQRTTAPRRSDLRAAWDGTTLRRGAGRRMPTRLSKPGLRPTRVTAVRPDGKAFDLPLGASGARSGAGGKEQQPPSPVVGWGTSDGSRAVARRPRLRSEVIIRPMQPVDPPAVQLASVPPPWFCPG